MASFTPTKGSYDYLRDEADRLIKRKHELLEQMQQNPDSEYTKQQYNKCLCDIERLRYKISKFQSACKKYIEEQNADDKS